MDVYDIDKIIGEAMRSGIDISPNDRQEWKMFCCALKVLGYDEHTFVALSSGKDKDSRQAWRAERNPSRYKTEEDAKAMIAALAKNAGMDMKHFLLSPRTEYRATTTNRRPTSAHKVAPTAPHSQPIVSNEPQYISEQQVNAVALRYKETSLYAYLCKWFDNAEVEQVMNAYKVGASKYINQQGGRAACFPYIGYDGRCVDCKIFHIDPTTGSRKTAPPLRSWTTSDGTEQHLPTTWALAEMKKKDSRAAWCNFGDHFLSLRPSDVVCIVESEKSALILAMAYPQHIWIAVGSMQNLTLERFKPYRGRKVIVFPDRDGITAWSDKARILAANGYDIRIDTTTARHDGEAKDDLADIVIRTLQGKQTPATTPEPEHKTTPPQPSSNQQAAIEAWEDMKQRYPHLVEFEKALQLVPISVEPLKDYSR